MDKSVVSDNNKTSRNLNRHKIFWLQNLFTRHRYNIINIHITIILKTEAFQTFFIIWKTHNTLAKIQH